MSDPFSKACSQTEFDHVRYYLTSVSLITTYTMVILNTGINGLKLAQRNRIPVYIFRLFQEKTMSSQRTSLSLFSAFLMCTYTVHTVVKLTRKIKDFVRKLFFWSFKLSGEIHDSITEDALLMYYYILCEKKS